MRTYILEDVYGKRAFTAASDEEAIKTIQIRIRNLNLNPGDTKLYRDGELIAD